MPQLRAVSDDWLDAKAGAEKGFSLGFFDETYLQTYMPFVSEERTRTEALGAVSLAEARRGDPRLPDRVRPARAQTPSASTS